MTTETAGTTGLNPRSSGARALVGAVVATVVVGLVLVALAAAVADRPAVLGALVGSAVGVVVFAFGTFSVDAVAKLMPAASLLVALVTYTLQIVVMALVFVALSRSGLLGADLDRGWLGGAIIAVALVWSAAQLRLATTARIPAYDLPSHPAGPPAEGGAR